MANEEKKEGEEGAAAPAPKSSKGKLLIIGGAAAVLLLIVIVIVVIVFTGKKGHQEDETAKVREVEINIKEETPEQIVQEGVDEADLYDDDEVPLGVFYPIPVFVVNLAQGDKFLRLQIQLEFAGRDIPSKFYSYEVILRDAILTMITNRTAEELTTSRGKEMLRKDIKQAINDKLRRSIIKEVYFTQFLIQ